MAPTAVTAKRRTLIADLATVFQARGYEGATLTHLAAATGLSKASLYHHFPGGKAEIVAVLVRDAVADLHQAFARLQGTDPPDVKLKRFVDAFADYVEAGRGHCLVAVLIQGSIAEQHGDLIAKQFEDWRDALATQFEALGSKPKRARREAGELLASLYGLLLTGKLLRDPDHFRRGIRRLKRGIQESKH